MRISIILLFLTAIGCGFFKKNKQNTNVSDINVVQNDSNTPLGYKTLQSFKGDTLSYIKENFLNNKRSYIGKDVNYLIGNLEVPVHHYLPHLLTEVDTVSGMTLLFYSDVQREVRGKNKVDPLVLVLKWKDSMPFDSIGTITRKNKLAWTDNEKKYIGKQIIKDISLVKYN